MSNYKNAYTEVCTILEYLDEEEYDKIPQEIIEALEENKNVEYDYQINEDLDLKEQPMLPETKAILFNLFRDYLSTPEQKEKIIRMQKEERQRNEEIKQQKYSVNVFQNKKKETVENVIKEEPVEIVKYKENIFTKIINWIKGLFKK